MIFIYDNSITSLLRTALVYYKSLMDSTLIFVGDKGQVTASN